MAFALVIGLLCVPPGRAREETALPTPPRSISVPYQTGVYEVQLLPALFPNNDAVILTPRLGTLSGAQSDPKHGWRFTVACYGYFRNDHLSQPELRFRVYAQAVDDLPQAQRVCRLLLRLQQIAWQRVRLQVNLQGERVLNVWLCRQGNAGGEQWRNNLYIYSVQELHSPVEWVREVAHEFSHALFPGITGYTLPEPWANGYLGERLLMTWIAPLAESGSLTTDDLCGASAPDVRNFVAQRCLPLRNRWLTEGFPKEGFTRTDASGMATLIGFVLYLDSVYGSSTLRATFARLAEPHATALWKAFTESVKEADEVTILPPDRASALWLPAGTWQVDSTDRKALLEQGKHRWQVSQPRWRLPGDGWYRLTSNAPVRLRRQNP